LLLLSGESEKRLQKDSVSMTSADRSSGDHYSSEFDRCSKDDWYRTIDRFSDANIYQTWSYDAVRCGERNLSHFVLRSGSEVVAAAQARLVKVPLLGIGVAYIRWGPMWRRSGHEPDSQIFRMALRELRQEYVVRRRMILRIFPYAFADGEEDVSSCLLAEGYQPVPDENAGRTLLLDLTPSEEEIRKNLAQKWRNCLNRAERNELSVVSGTEDDLFETFIGLYRQLLDRKQFIEPNDINEFRKIQQDLPQRWKMRIFLCDSGGPTSAGAICAATGDTGSYLFGAINEEGMKNKGSYLLQWKAIQWMKNQGCSRYNLNGINPKSNPGSYHFKAGIAGKTGRDLAYLGRFDCYRSRFALHCAKIGDRVLPFIREAGPFISRVGR